MIFKYLLILMLLIPEISCGYPFYRYDQSKIKIHPAIINKYLRPQLKSIINEFYGTLKKIHPINAELIKLKKLTFEANVSWQTWYTDCLVLNEVCSKNLKDLKRLQRSIEKLLINLQKNSFNKEYFTNEFMADSICILSGDFDELFNLNYKTIHALAEIQILSVDSKLPYQGKTDFIGNSIHKMQLISERILTAGLPKDLQKEYFDLWFFYIKDIEQYLTYNLDDQFLFGRLAVLNIHWNIFHMKLSKNIVKAPASILKTLNIMHSRWDSVLKIIMKNHRL